MAKFEVLQSFGTASLHGSKGKVVDIDDQALAYDLYNAGYVKPVDGGKAPVKPKKAPKKSADEAPAEEPTEPATEPEQTPETESEAPAEEAGEPVVEGPAPAENIRDEEEATPKKAAPKAKK